MNNLTLDLTPYFGELQSHSLMAASQFSDNTPLSFFLDSQDRLGLFLQQGRNQSQNRSPALRGKCTDSSGRIVSCDSPDARRDGMTTRSQFPYVITDEGGVAAPSGSPGPQAASGWKDVEICVDAQGNEVPKGTPGSQCSMMKTKDAGIEAAIKDGIKIFPDGFLESFSVGGDTFNAMGFGLLALLLVIAGIYLMKG